jgi:glutathionyl-hydroquinone reductase
MINNYEKSTYEEITELLPKKTSTQILNRAKKLGLKRDKSLMPEKIYYDKDKKYWKHTYETENAIVTACYPASEEESYEEARQKVVKNMARVFNDLSNKYYYDFLAANNLPDDPRFRDIHFKLTFDKFVNKNTDHYVNEVNSVIDEINKEISARQKSEK